MSDRLDPTPEPSIVRHDPPVPPEQALWTAVVIQAISDATGTDRRTRNAARRWLLGGMSDLVTVCNLAGIEPSALRRYARTLARSDWPRPTMFQDSPENNETTTPQRTSACWPPLLLNDHGIQTGDRR